MKIPVQNIEIFKGLVKIDNIYQSFNSIEQLKSICRMKYFGNVQIYINGTLKCKVRCNSENYFKREFIYK